MIIVPQHWINKIFFVEKKEKKSILTLMGALHDSIWLELDCMFGASVEEWGKGKRNDNLRV